MNHIVALSGGKDSTAMALWLKENEPRDYKFVITPTGDELPPMIDHWKHLEELLGTKLTVVSCGMSLKGLNKQQNALPNFRMRFCTRLLKLEPFKRFMLEHAPAIAYVGLRADEADRVGMDYGKAGGEVYGAVDGITQRFPLRELGWGVGDVWDYLQSRRVTIPIRTDCARCFWQRLGEWYALWLNYPAIYEDAVQEEIVRQHTYRSPSRDTQPASLFDLREKFESGYIPRGYKPAGEMQDREQMCRACSL